MEFTHHLNSAFIPRSVAVIGASDREGSRGSYIWKGVMNSRLALEAFPVNPKYKYLGVVPCWSRLADLPTKIDLAVIATPSQSVMGLLKECAALNIQNVLITLGEPAYAEDRLWRQEVLKFVRKNNMRMIGPDSIGVMRPSIGLNVSFWPELPESGHIGLICQSATLASSILEYAKSCRFGFSSIITSGRESDVSLPEIIDFLAADKETQYIAIHAEHLRQPRQFFSAIKAASVHKPVIILHASQGANASRFISARTATIASNDKVFDALIRQCGAIRCLSLEEFCATLQVFALNRLPRADRLCILGNGLGLCTLMADAADRVGINGAALNTQTIKALSSATGSNKILPHPVDIGSAATTAQYGLTLKTVLGDDNADAVLVGLAPSPSAEIRATLRELQACSQNHFKPVVLTACGETLDIHIRNAVRQSGVPYIASIDHAVSAIRHLFDYVRIRQELIAVSTDEIVLEPWDKKSARKILDNLRSRSSFVPDQESTMRFLNTAGIACSKTYSAKTTGEALDFATELGYPVVLKLMADGVMHKSEIGGIALNINSNTELKKAFETIESRCKLLAPMSVFNGVMVQSMVSHDSCREFSLRMRYDPALGPAISVGVGGQMGDIYEDSVCAVPPISHKTARKMIRSLACHKCLNHFRGLPPVPSEPLEQMIVRLSEVVSEFPTIAELTINPIVIDNNHFIALDASMLLSSQPITTDLDHSHLVSSCSPTAIEESIKSQAGLMILRSVRPEDIHALRRMVMRLSDQSSHMYYQKSPAEVTDFDLTVYCNPDFDRQFAITVVDDSTIGPEIHGIGKFIWIPGTATAEFGILVEDTYQHKGLGKILMRTLETEAKRRGIMTLHGFIMKANEPMVAFMKARHYVASECPSDSSMQIFTLTL